MGDFNFHFENVENNSRKLHDIIDMLVCRFLKLGQGSASHNEGHLLDLVFSKQSYNVFISAKLHHGLTSDHTAILCKLDVSVPVQKPATFSYRCLKKIDTGAFKQDLSHAVSQTNSISDYNNHLCSVLDKHAPLCRCTACTRKPTPWFSSIAEQYCELKWERWQAARRRLQSKITAHKQIFDSIKQKITRSKHKKAQTNAWYMVLWCTKNAPRRQQFHVAPCQRCKYTTSVDIKKRAIISYSLMWNHIRAQWVFSRAQNSAI